MQEIRWPQAKVKGNITASHYHRQFECHERYRLGMTIQDSALSEGVYSSGLNGGTKQNFVSLEQKKRDKGNASLPDKKHKAICNKR